MRAMFAFVFVLLRSTVSLPVGHTRPPTSSKHGARLVVLIMTALRPRGSSRLGVRVYSSATASSTAAEVRSLTVRSEFVVNDHQRRQGIVLRNVIEPRSKHRRLRQPYFRTVTAAPNFPAIWDMSRRRERPPQMMGRFG